MVSSDERLLDLENGNHFKELACRICQGSEKLAAAV